MLAVGVVNTGIAGHSTELGPGNAEITGAVLSVTLIVCDAVEVLPQSSVAVQVLVTEYSCGQVPGVVTSANVMLTLGSQASVAVAAGNTGVAGQLIVDVAGNGSITGGVPSTDNVLKDDTGLLQPVLTV